MKYAIILARAMRLYRLRPHISNIVTSQNLQTDSAIDSLRDPLMPID